MPSTLPRRPVLRLLALAAALAGLAGHALARDAGEHDRDESGPRHGKLFVSSNAPGGNELLVYAAHRRGPATLQAQVPTQGLGTGAGLGSQGAVTLSTDGRYLFVVNAGSNTVSTFKLGRDGLVLGSVVDAGGLTPISVAENDGLVYVLDAGGSGNVAGFRNQGGVLTPLSDGVRGLSVNTGAAPAQVGFDRDGAVLVVSEKNTGVLTSYAVRDDGTLADRTVPPSAGRVPFGFAITRDNVLVVSEAAASTVSSYRLRESTGPRPQLVSAAVPNGQIAACWIAVTPNGRYAYSANAGSSSISRYGIGRDGSLTLLAAQAGFTSNNGIVDMAVSPNGRRLHALAPRAPQQIVSFDIAADGSLTRLGAVDVPAGTAGLAAD